MAPKALDKSLGKEFLLVRFHVETFGAVDSAVSQYLIHGNIQAVSLVTRPRTQPVASALA